MHCGQLGQQRADDYEQQAGDSRRGAGEHRVLIARLERLRGRSARGVARRQQRADHGDGDAGGEVDDGARERKRQMRRDVAERAGAEVAAPGANRDDGQGVSEYQTERGAHHAKDRSQQDRLVRRVDGERAFAGPGEAGDQGGAADADQDGVAADEPAQVAGRCLGRLRGHVQVRIEGLEAAGEKPIGQAHDEDQQLL